jgi:hypothetical protein
MSLVNAFYVVARFDGKIKRLLTIDRREFQILLHDLIQNNPQIDLEIKQYPTTEKEFLNDLRIITSEVISGA